MISIRDGKLSIFEDFRTDFKLPKHTKKKNQDGPEEEAQEGEWKTIPEERVFSGSFALYENPEARSLTRGFLSRIKQRLLRKKPIPPAQTMKIVFQSLEQLQVFKSRQEVYNNLVEKAKKNGQVAWHEALIERQKIQAYEDALISMDKTGFIQEETLVQLAQRSDKAFRLDWIKNFMRIIPDEVSDKKALMDKSLIFDNYVILHYDPDNKGNKLTKEEVAAQRDPILFGVIEGSRKLYFIADWVDSLCGLTFEELIKEIERTEVPDAKFMRGT